MIYVAQFEGVYAHDIAAVGEDRDVVRAKAMAACDKGYGPAFHGNDGYHDVVVYECDPVTDQVREIGRATRDGEVGQPAKLTTSRWVSGA